MLAILARFIHTRQAVKAAAKLEDV